MKFKTARQGRSVSAMRQSGKIVSLFMFDIPKQVFKIDFKRREERK